MDKLKLFLYLARHPTWWPEIARRARVNLLRLIARPKSGADRGAATAWAKREEISEAALFDALGLTSSPSLTEFRPEIIAQTAKHERQLTEQLGGGGSADLLYRLCESLAAKTVVETGVAYGWSSLAILLSITKREGRLYSNDMPYLHVKDRSIIGSAVPHSLRNSWKLDLAPDYTSIPNTLKSVDQIDLFHYDSDKSYEGRILTYRNVWPSIRSGGLLVSDDIADNMAFRDFSTEIAQKPFVVDAEGAGRSGKRHIGILRKP